MLQQLLATIIIGFFIIRLFLRKQNKEIKISEFIVWLFFWLLALAAVLFIKKIDKIAAGLGFSASGIEILLYLAIVIVFYLIIRLNLKIERAENNITKIVREIALKDKP